jgi:hypothetical protein
MVPAHVKNPRFVSPIWSPWTGLLFGLLLSVSTFGHCFAAPSKDSTSLLADGSQQKEAVEGTSRGISAKRSVARVDCPAPSKVAIATVPRLASVTFAPVVISTSLVSVFATLNGTGSHLRC